MRFQTNDEVENFKRIYFINPEKKKIQFYLNESSQPTESHNETYSDKKWKNKKKNILLVAKLSQTMTNITIKEIYEKILFPYSQKIDFVKYSDIVLHRFEFF